MQFFKLMEKWYISRILYGEIDTQHHARKCENTFNKANRASGREGMNMYWIHRHFRFWVHWLLNVCIICCKIQHKSKRLCCRAISLFRPHSHRLSRAFKSHTLKYIYIYINTLPLDEKRHIKTSIWIHLLCCVLADTKHLWMAVAQNFHDCSFLSCCCLFFLFSDTVAYVYVSQSNIYSQK